MLDPITLATLTAAISSLGVECARGSASEAGKDAWRKISPLFGWKADQLQVSNSVSDIARTLHDSPYIAQEVLAILQADERIGSAGKIAEKLVIANTITTVNM